MKQVEISGRSRDFLYDQISGKIYAKLAGLLWCEINIMLNETIGDQLTYHIEGWMMEFEFNRIDNEN